MRSKNSLLLFLSCFIYITAFSQSLKGKITDTNNTPISYATVQIGKNYGVLSNQEGEFSIIIPVTNENSRLEISYMGYETLEIPISNIKPDDTYVLIEKVNELGAVMVSNKELTPLEIINTMLEKAPDNYTLNNFSQTFFLRTSTATTLEDFEFEIDRATDLDRKARKGLNADIEKFTKDVKGQNFKYFVEYLGDLAFHKDSSKLFIQKGIYLKNKDQEISEDKMSEKVINLIKNYLDPDASYKVKTGLFKVEDSLTTADIFEEDNDSLKGNTSYLKKNLVAKNIEFLKFYDNEDVDFFEKQNRYDYTLDGYTTIDDETVYIITFTPRKGSADYSGKMYINAFDYALVRLECKMQPDKNLHNLNLKFLLGVKFRQDRVGMTYVFQKNDEGKYEIKFVKKEDGMYAYMSRPIKFIKNRADRSEDKQILKFDFTFETNVYSVREYYVLNQTTINEQQFSEIEAQEKFTPVEIEKYNPTIWEGYNVIAPIEDIKNYGQDD
ncbi:carboxypeptidase-like regulatory domain-containing protein [Neptunitalea lumnitzerae]|uniref:Carboxypeptidase-like regulatory domain-containing protein n=1 Tax=Neptunitalea lumnitzerae TaxID=2965509 RepID=A0ABQ5MMD9_9FLAO|nr:carboxypeptidase-like regulatory domain-containing protein [Neptunitalea sp. Y10]GLB50127.1 hypothetical protein Y10_24950 [Neptunitalea sp. Y10]